ncbi:hypothetical protein LTR99_005795 [Exophiala xenobiotica]|uniref:Uncharacterized protein n=1 Tax=Vermiconidia calcicola TaxID=1690605 RepID=A0AAV9QHH9_9PEZI|nr:hypothetical protein LTR99_005795 [Exophiala xenobiotica]KAK5431031.1 hypothetical protein LTR34_005590 [Exophiala xenobiotica]KAK5541131.1 hypothetical protein LTR25_002908 [Vermiconidia calcicola]KAK5549376.1 hypothetical protein LTR23_000484 [Chaetothyriales sp. CCFEE 6169]KAK5557754.1 hypothetical protein LTR46_003932 [Exophiala xenobiotica]
MAPQSLDPATFDRTDLTTRHEGPLVLPHDLLFHRLHFLAFYSNTSAVKDAFGGIDVNYRQLLSDVVAARNRIRAAISAKALDAIYDEREASFVLIARGYEFVVLFLAVLALGGIAVPTSIHITQKELSHVLRTSRASATICSRDYTSIAQSGSPAKENEEDYVVVTLDDMVDNTPVTPSTLTFSSSKTPDPNKPGLIIFTSGSTGPPKGVALRRYNLFAVSSLQCWRQNIRPGYVGFNLLPTHHATGLLVNILPVLVGGGCVEFTPPKFDAVQIWERIKFGGINLFSAVPTIYVRLLQHWEKWSPGIDAVERELYQTAVSNIEQFHCGSAALPTSIASRWAALCRGRQIAERYGGTEFGNPFAHSPGVPVVTGSVGTTNPGIESYLEQGEEGEIFVRSPFLFSKYIYDIEATKKSLTADGFFKTGDVAEKHGENFFIKGRKSVDILKSGGYKISALDVERQILEHPIIAEAIVVGVDDDEFGQRIAAAVVLNEGADSLSLPELRSFLRDKLSSYKLPTILRVVRELPKTTTLKVPKLLIKKDLFGTDHPDIRKWSASSVKL